MVNQTLTRLGRDGLPFAPRRREAFAATLPNGGAMRYRVGAEELERVPPMVHRPGVAVTRSATTGRARRTDLTLPASDEDRFGAFSSAISGRDPRLVVGPAPEHATAPGQPTRGRGDRWPPPEARHAPATDHLKRRPRHWRYAAPARPNPLGAEDPCVEVERDRPVAEDGQADVAVRVHSQLVAEPAGPERGRGLVGHPPVRRQVRGSTGGESNDTFT